MITLKLVEAGRTAWPGGYGERPDTSCGNAVSRAAEYAEHSSKPRSSIWHDVRFSTLLLPARYTRLCAYVLKTVLSTIGGISKDIYWPFRITAGVSQVGAARSFLLAIYPM